jgi:hypothetical protein
MLKENNKTQEELEKEIAALEQSIQVAKDSNLDKLVIDVLEETKSNFERELSGFLRIKEVVSDDEKIDYYLLKDGVEIHLNAFVEDQICEELVIYNNDLVFIQIFIVLA